VRPPATTANNHIHILRFGLFELELPRGVLTRHGTRVKLQDQPFRILELLLEEPGQIVSREQFRKALWPEGTHVNFDGSLNAALKKLRSALQDDADNPRFVETVPRQGYRFLAPVQVVNDSPAPAMPGQVSRSEDGNDSVEVRLRFNPELSTDLSAPVYWSRERAERTQQWFDSLLLTVGIAFGSWFLFFIVYPVPHPSMQRMNRIANASRIDEWGGITSDGTRIFFLEREGKRWNLMQTSVEGGNAEKMPAPFENTRVFSISPDHSQFLIGQFTRRDQAMALWLWPVQGGEPRRLGKATGEDPAWSPDGSQIVFVSGAKLYSIRRDGTQMRQLAELRGHPHVPAWSPDGESIRFTVDQEEFGNQSIWEMSAEGNGLHPILGNQTQPTNQSGGNWTADGKYFLFTGCEHSNCNVWAMRAAWSWFRRSHHEPYPLTSGPDSLHVAIPQQMGSRIFAFSFRPHREMVKIEPGTGRESTLSFDSAAAGASISPNEEMMVYSNWPDGSLWSSRADGSARLRLASPPLRGSEPRWSPNSGEILFTGIREGQARYVYVISADGGSLHAVLPADWEGTEADWSPDGYRIVVNMRNLKAKKDFALYLVEPTTWAVKELPDSRGLSEPRWSPDGRFIAAVDEAKHHVMLFDVEKKQWSSAGEGDLIGGLEWSRDGAAIYFQDRLEEGESVYRVKMGSPQMEKVFSFSDILKRSASHCFFSGLGRDGTLYVMMERGMTDIYSLDLDLP